LHVTLSLAYRAWCGVAWRGLAWLGLAWLGLAWLGLAWREKQRVDRVHSMHIIHINECYLSTIHVSRLKDC
ncbi:hypothetical protein ALC60_08529, partial [Trachymyrmex zeteki]